MQRLLLGSAITLASVIGASAADLYVKAPPPAWSWTGCYIGAQGGYSSGRTNAISAGTENGVPDGTLGAVKVPSNTLQGGLGGGTLGCNYQFAKSWVLGVEGDGSWGSITGSSILPSPPFFPGYQEDFKETWLATVRGRLGYSFDRLLIYATGGGAFAGATIHEYAISSPSTSATDTQTLSGWIVGGGVEYAFWRHWSLKVEYLHADLGTTRFFATFPGFTAEDRRVTDDIVRAGINYRF
jgi:outer membrane immunogenic protein